MSSYTIMTDAALNVDSSVVDAHAFHTIPMSVTVNEQQFNIQADTPKEEISSFYKLLLAHPAYTTQIAQGIYDAHFKAALEKGEDILYLCMSSGLSATYSQAQLAAKMLSEDFPDRQVHIVDTRICAAAGNFIVHRAVENKARGLNLAENAKDLESYRDKVVLCGFIARLDHLKRSGRLSGAQALMGSALSIKPVLYMTKDGDLILKNKARGSKQAMKQILKFIDESLDASETRCFITHGDDFALAEEVKDKILKETAIETVYIDVLSPIISAHLGQGGLALSFVAKSKD